MWGTKPKPQTQQYFIKFGRYNRQLDYIDQQYNKLATRLINYAKEVGTNGTDRYFDAEELMEFVIAAGLTDKSPDYMYRHYVYHILSRHEKIDVDKEELDHLLREFLLLPTDENHL